MSLTRHFDGKKVIGASDKSEHGVVLAGPDPKDLIDPVPRDKLEGEAREGMREYAAFARDSQERFEIAGEERPGMSRWKQPYLVLTCCRLLHTLDRGIVTSKRAAGEWALAALEPRWASLIQQALNDRPDPWKRVHEPAAAEPIARTLAFADYALGEAGSR